MVLVFDLDDTLYDESTYMQSGFREVSKFLVDKVNIGENVLYDCLLQIEKESGRGEVFDLLLKKLKFYSKDFVAQCISVYRLHRPQIFLNEDSERCLKRFANLPLYVVTDGNKLVQYKKVRALGLDSKVKKVYVTHQFGLKYSKPSSYCFHCISKEERVRPEEIVYIGDNPKKDFIGIKPEGFKTVRIVQGMFKNVSANEKEKAHCEIKTLDELDNILLNRLL